jgi:mannosyl-3-phosphoglycerate synthase
MEIETLCLPHLITATRFGDLDYFVRHTAFVVCHKSEPLETLFDVLRYLPEESPRIIVTNCPPHTYAELRYELGRDVALPEATFLVHQKDERIARLFEECGVSHILDASGRVVNGKGEGMYIGALIAALLGMPKWIVYFDADNHAPSALLEYIMAMGQLFTAPTCAEMTLSPTCIGQRRRLRRLPLHNVRVCWASKPVYDGETFVPQPHVAGRCTRVIAPLCDELVRTQHPGIDRALLTPNAGEQGMTMATAMALRFSAGFSVETFQLLELLFARARCPDVARRVLLQQYTSGSPHFHQKKDDEHIHGMIAESLGSFLAFQRYLPTGMLQHIAELAADMGTRITCPATYPALGRLPLAGYSALPAQFRLDAVEDAVSA